MSNSRRNLTYPHLLTLKVKLTVYDLSTGIRQTILVALTLPSPTSPHPSSRPILVPRRFSGVVNQN